MGRGVEKIFGLCLFASIAAMLAAGSAVAIAADETLQPQGLNYTGIYALRQLDPNLTGAGIKFAVVCRSNTYIDGEPQNDYRPAISHICFKDKQLNFNNQDDPPPDTSPHSTAICSILLGEDPNAVVTIVGRRGTYRRAIADNNSLVITGGLTNAAEYAPLSDVGLPVYNLY